VGLIDDWLAELKRKEKKKMAGYPEIGGT